MKKVFLLLCSIIMICCFAAACDSAPEKFSGITFSDAEYTYNGSQRIITVTGLPEGASAEYTYESAGGEYVPLGNGLTEAGVYNIKAVITKEGYETLTLTAKLKIIGEITGVTFLDDEFDYDGTEKSISVSNLPEGASVEYTYENAEGEYVPLGSGLTEAGEYNIRAVITKENHAPLTLNAKLKIVLGNITGVTFLNNEFDYDGTEKSISVSNLPEGASVEYTYENAEGEYVPLGSGLTEVGEYNIRAVITKEGYETLSLTAKLKIIGEITGVVFENQELDYDGTEKSISVSNLPAGASVSYEGNGQTEPGVYTVTATVSMENYHDEVLTAQITIFIKFDGYSYDSSVTYNGSNQVFTVHGLPEDTQVTYCYVNEDGVEVEENTFFKPGVYQVTVKLSKPLYRYTELKIDFEIKKARLILNADSKEKQLYEKTNPEFTVTAAGLKGSDEFDLYAQEGIFRGSLVLTTTAEQYSPLGFYEIKALELPESDYYDIIFRTGLLEIVTFETNMVKGGMHLNNDGVTVYNDKQVNWLGVNYFNMFYHCFNSTTGEVREDKVQEVYKALETLKSYNVKAIRFSNFFFYATEMKPWLDNREVMLMTYERILNKAASLDIGLIPSFFWTFSIAGYYGSTMDNMGDPENNTTQGFKAAMEYTKIFVERFYEHPAILMWEFGNEWNLAMDHDNEGRIDGNILIEFRTYWSDYVRSLDPYERLIGSGDSELRAYQYNLNHGNGWRKDTYEQHKEMMGRLNSGSTDSISIHTYTPSDLMRLVNKSNDSVSELERLRGMTQEEFEEERAKLNISNLEIGGQIEEYFGATNLKELFSYLMNIAAELGKSCYIGEAGFSVGTYGETARLNGLKSDYTWEEFELSYLAYVDAIIETKVPLVLFWNYDPISKPSSIYLNDRGSGIEHSWNDEYWTKGQIILDAIKYGNDLIDQN